LSAFGRCSGISFVDSTMIPVCHNLRRYTNKVFKGLATDGKGTMGWCLKNTAQLVHSRHRSVNNFIMNVVATLAAYSFFDNKPQALQGVHIEKTGQIMLF
ncbi:MAG: hypothetical protein IJ013_06805, partial [Bacteroidaceae bacterium]|nr:hypothetical protein [Bacteroidaceae bacterium]